MTLKVIQGHRMLCDSIGNFLSVVCINNVSVVHRFWYVTTFTVYVAACDLENSFSFATAVKITGHVPFTVRV